MRFNLQASSNEERAFFSDLIDMVSRDKTSSELSRLTGRNLKVRFFFLGFRKQIFFFLSSTERELREPGKGINFLRKESSIFLTLSLETESHVIKTYFRFFFQYSFYEKFSFNFFVEKENKNKKIIINNYLKFRGFPSFLGVYGGIIGILNSPLISQNTPFVSPMQFFFPTF